ncbi:amidase domain-containing protein [Agromyces sp. Marseille-P2726]|uniref:amidase domain-containing protein n=1 Tax=Agromyces sp. Marseille-P2726 TaxID=2709132 RepID=UPI00156F0AC4|nr:amidase domain-containing protein [Agromyces sp. Marseille-P2726]
MAAVLAAGTGVGVAAVVAGIAPAPAPATSAGDVAAGGASGTAESQADEASAGGRDTAGMSMGVAEQFEYVREHWDATDSDQFGFLPENDCMNFASQSLLVRGWAPDDDWWYDESGDEWSHPTAWVSSTSFMEYAEQHPERATALTDDQRDQVKVGDLVQFDWDDSGDRDHTGVVTSVRTELDGSITIEYAGHTDATWDRSVDWAITTYHPGGVAYYWSIPDTPPLVE